MLDLAKVRLVILTWTYNTLNSQYPNYFNKNPYKNIAGATVTNSPNVYWADTVSDRPIDATECYLDIISDDSSSFGTDGEYYQDTDNKYYYKITEQHEVTVSFTVSSMKNKLLELSALQAQNLTYNACSYLKMMLKTGSASDYFRYENEIIDEPILVCTQPANMSEITDTSIFEDTRNRHTNTFSCKFRFDVVTKREVNKAQSIYGTVVPNETPDLAQDFEVELETE